MFRFGIPCVKKSVICSYRLGSVSIESSNETIATVGSFKNPSLRKSQVKFVVCIALNGPGYTR